MNDSRNISVLLFEQKLIYYTELPEKKSMVSSDIFQQWLANITDATER